VPWRLASQTVLVRADDDVVGMFFGKKQVAAHRRSWKMGEDIEHPSHRDGLLKIKPRAAAGALPPGLIGLADTGTATRMLNDLAGAEIHGQLERALRRYCLPTSWSSTISRCWRIVARPSTERFISIVDPRGE
jgi:hypothetical protein